MPTKTVPSTANWPKDEPWPVDELRQEGREEQGRLRVQDLGRNGLQEGLGGRHRGQLRQARVVLRRLPQGADAEVEQIGRTEVLDRVERQRGRHQQRRQPDGRAQRMDEVPGGHPQAGQDAGLAPAMHGARQNQQHSGPRNQEQAQHHDDERSQGRQVWHVVSLRFGPRGAARPVARPAARPAGHYRRFHAVSLKVCRALPLTMD